MNNEKLTMNNQWSEIDNQNNEQSAIKTTNNQQSKQWAISNQRNQQSSIKRNQQSAIKTINRDHLGGNHLVFPVGIPLPGPCVVLSGIFLYFVFCIFFLYFVLCICYSVHFCNTKFIGLLVLEQMRDFPLQAAHNIGLEGLLQRILKQTW